MLYQDAKEEVKYAMDDLHVDLSVQEIDEAITYCFEGMDAEDAVKLVLKRRENPKR